MSRADRNAARFLALVQAHVPERVVAAGYLCAPGSATASAFGGSRTGLLGPAIGDRVERQAREAAAADGFPANSWLGVTATRVYAFVADRGTVGEIIGVWDRHDTTVTKSEKLATTRLALRFGASGPTVELEARKWGAGNHQLLRYLLDPSRAD